MIYFGFIQKFPRTEVSIPFFIRCFKKVKILYVNSTTQRCPNKIIFFFLLFFSENDSATDVHVGTQHSNINKMQFRKFNEDKAEISLFKLTGFPSIKRNQSIFKACCLLGFKIIKTILIEDLSCSVLN